MAKQIGTKLHDLRLAKGITLKELGSKVGASHCFLSNLENNKNYPTLSTIINVAKGLGYDVEIDFVPTGTGDPEKVVESFGENDGRHLRKAEKQKD